MALGSQPHSFGTPPPSPGSFRPSPWHGRIPGCRAARKALQPLRRLISGAQDQPLSASTLCFRVGSAVTSVPGLIWGDAAKREDAGESPQIHPFCWMARALWAVPTGFSRSFRRPWASGCTEHSNPHLYCRIVAARQLLELRCPQELLRVTPMPCQTSAQDGRHLKLAQGMSAKWPRRRERCRVREGLGVTVRGARLGREFGLCCLSWRLKTWWCRLETWSLSKRMKTEEGGAQLRPFKSIVHPPIYLLNSDYWVPICARRCATCLVYSSEQNRQKPLPSWHHSILMLAGQQYF